MRIENGIPEEVVHFTYFSVLLLYTKHANCFGPILAQSDEPSKSSACSLDSELKQFCKKLCCQVTVENEYERPVMVMLVRTAKSGSLKTGVQNLGGMSEDLEKLLAML